MDGSIDPVEHPRAGAHRRLLVIHGFCFVITVLAIFLLPAFVAAAAAVVEPVLQNAQRSDRGSELPVIPVLPETRGRSSPELPEIQPSAPPPSSLTVPAPAPPPEAASLRQGPRFVLRDVNIIGNTVLDEATIRGVVDPYLSKPVTIGDLEEIRRQFTLLYINRGYINSGAIIPDQNVANGVVAFRFVEGRVNDVEVSGTEHFDPEYFRSRLARGTEPPFNVEIWGASSRSYCRARW
jgi:hemolysin activation/secretion protein